MNSNELVTVERESYVGRPIDRDLVVEFGDTLMGVHPNAKEVGLQGMRTVAQLALITGANPLPGTNGIHAWRDKKNNLIITFGVGFWRTQAELEGGILWVDRPRPMTTSEREYYGILDQQIASICKAALRKGVFRLMDSAREFGQTMSIKDAKEEVARVGVAIVNPNEYDAKGRNKQWKADLRAERDLLRQLVPIMQRSRQNAIEGAHVQGGLDWSAGEFAHLQSGEELPDDYSADDANVDLFGDEPAGVIEGTIDAETGEIVGDEPEPESEPDNGDKKNGAHVTASMLRDLHVAGTAVHKKEWNTERAKMSKALGKESSKDWSLDEYFGVLNGLEAERDNVELFEDK